MGSILRAFLSLGKGFSPPQPGIRPETNPPILHILPLIAHQLASARKKLTPALTLPQLRQLIGGVIEVYLRTNVPEALCRRSTRWLQRNEQARFYQYRSRNILPPLKNRLRT